MGAVLRAARDCDVEFPREVDEFRIPVRPHDDAVELEQRGGGVEQLPGSQPGKRTSINVPDVVHARLQAVEIDSSQLLPNLRHAVQSKSAQLDLLPCRDI